MSMSDEKIQALEVAMSHIEKQFGKGSIMKLGANKIMDIEVIPTGCLALDIALGVGGVPRGRVMEIYGPESSGKTTVALHIVAEAQKRGGTAAFIDAEHALDPSYARKLGVNIDDLIVSQPDTGEQGLEIAEAIVRSNAVDVIVVDSVGALVPKVEIEGEMGDEVFGNRTRIKITKNKVAPPFKQAEFDIMYNEGISKEGNLIDIAVNEGFVQKGGAWFSYKDVRLGQGRDNSKQYLKDNPDLALEIENLIRGKYNLPLVKKVINEEQAVEDLKKRE